MARKQNVVVRRGDETPREESPKEISGGWWGLIVLITVWFLTGFPFSFIKPQWVEVEGITDQASYGRTPISWHENIVPEMTTDLTQWGRNNGLHPDTLAGAVKAASLERDLATGKPMPGTGYRVDMFDILGINSVETVLSQNTVDPTVSNPTGGCIAWWELLKHKLLNGVLETNSLRKTVEPLGFNATEVYGSCGAGAIGWTQALPSNWWNLMGPGFDPWKLEDSAEFTARYLTLHRYFTSGRRSAVLSYNPGAGDSYVNPVIAKADSLRASFEASGISIPTTTVKTTVEAEEIDPVLEEPIVEETKVEEAKLPAQVVRPTKDAETTISVFPVDGPKGGWAFGVPTSFQLAHTGVDILSPVGTKVKSPCPGIVESTAWYPAGWEPTGLGHGKTIWVFCGYDEKGEAVRVLVAHLSEYVSSPGDWVEAGQLIAYTGNTGAGTGPHAHIAVRIGGGCFQCKDQFDGRWEDPYEWIGNGRVIYTEFPSDFNPSTGNTTQTAPNSNQKLADTHVTLTLRKTPVLSITLWLGGKVQDIDEAIGLLQEIADLIDQASSAADGILEAEEAINNLDSFLKSVGIDISAKKFLENIKEADKLLERVTSIVDFLIKTQESLLELHRKLSVLSIGGQPRDLGLDPLLNWRLYPTKSNTEGGDAK